MTETRAKWTDLIPDVGLRIAEVIDQASLTYQPGISGILKTTTGSGAQRNFTGMTGFGEIKEFAEGVDVPAVTREKTYTTSVAYSNYGGSVQVTKNALEDRDFSEQLDEMSRLTVSMNVGTDKSGIQLLNGGYATTTTVNGYKVTWYADGVPQFSTVHPTPVVGGSTQSNASATGIPITHDNYQVGRLALELQQTDNGLPMTLAGKNTLIVPLALEKKAVETISSELTPETANNALNFFRGSADVMTTKYLDSVNGGSNTAWFIVKKGDHALYQEVRQAPRLEQDVDILSKTVTFTIDARWANYSRDWKGTWGSRGDSAAYAS